MHSHLHLLSHAHKHTHTHYIYIYIYSPHTITHLQAFIVVNKSSLGLSIAKPDEDGSENRGAFVMAIRNNSPADTCGDIEVGDQILKINGKAIHHILNGIADNCRHQHNWIAVRGGG